MFNKPHWLIFSNGSLIANLKGVELHYNSQVWVVQPQDAEFYSISEIYQVKSGFEERINYLGDWSQAYGLRMASLARMLRRGNLEGLKLRAGFTEVGSQLKTNCHSVFHFIGVGQSQKRKHGVLRYRVKGVVRHLRIVQHRKITEFHNDAQAVRMEWRKR